MADPLDPVAPGALAGSRIGVSVSESPDLAPRGLTETHLRLVLGEIARAILLADASLVYGGRFDPTGYTVFLRQELQRYSRRDKPLLVCLAWSEHRRMSLDALAAAKRDLGLYGEIVCLDSAGAPIDPTEGRGPAPEPIATEGVAAALSALRRFMTAETQARVLIGGRRAGYEGRLPGLFEEARLAVEAGRPLYFAGGFGGISGDIARELGLDPDQVLPPAPGSEADPEVAEALEELVELVDESAWSLGDNGLSLEENRQLAASHRPGEVASLIGSGLHRLKAADRL